MTQKICKPLECRKIILKTLKNSKGGNLHCPHCGKKIETSQPSDLTNYDERNPPPPTSDQAPPDFIGRGSYPPQTTDKDYHELEVYVEAESEKALLCTDAAPGDEGTFKDWFPKSQLRSQGGDELGGGFLNWKQTYQRLQFSGWILNKKNVPGF